MLALIIPSCSVVIEVSGRVFPVETVYWPIDHNREEEGDISYVDAAVNAVDLALSDPVRGDVLIFLPGERGPSLPPGCSPGGQAGLSATNLDIVPPPNRPPARYPRSVFSKLLLHRLPRVLSSGSLYVRVESVLGAEDTGAAAQLSRSPSNRPNP